MKTPALRFCVDENTLRTEVGDDYHVICLIEFSSNTETQNDR